MVGNLIDELSGLFIKANTKESFLSRLADGKILSNSIVFIIDTNEIWTQGHYWACPYSKEEIDALFSQVNDNIDQVRALYSELNSTLTQYQQSTNQLIIEKEQSAINALAAEVARASEQESKLATQVSSLNQNLNTEIGRATAAEEALRTTKVDKVTGKSLVSDVQITKLTNLSDQATITSNIADAKKAGTDAQASINLHTSNTSNPHGVTKAQVGLGNVDNTSDLSKPISTATQSALDGKVDKISGKGLSSKDYTKAEKDKLAGIEAGAQVNTVTGVKGNSETNYRTGNINITPTNIGLGNVNNTSDLNKPVSTATQKALNNKVDKVSGKGLSTNDYTSDEKTKLGSIESGANKTIIDSALSSTSTNPVQNKIIKAIIDEIYTRISWKTIE